MIRIRYLTMMLMLLLGSIGIWAQEDTFNPVNPPEPEQPAMRLTLRVNPSEAGSASGSGLYSPGKKVSINTYGNTAFRFVNWTNANGQIVSTEKNFSYTKQEGHEALTANYVFDPDSPADPAEPSTIMYYKLALVATEGGSVYGGGSYLAGKQVTLQAHPEADFNFDGWYDTEGNIISKDATYSYTTTAKHVMLTGRFVFNPENPAEPSEPVLSRTITATATDGGTTNFSSQRVLIGSTVSIQAYSNSGYTFLGWYLNGELYSNLTYFSYTVTEDKVQNFEARWEFNPASPSEPGMPTTTKDAFFLMNKVTKPGAVVQYPIYLSSVRTLKDMTFRLTFPQELQPDLESIEMSERATGYTVSCNEENDTTYLLSFIGGEVPAGNAAVIVLSVPVPDNIITGRGYPIKINQVTVTEEDGNIITASTRNGRISVYNNGDANIDGEVGMPDVMYIVNYILGNPAEDFNAEFADVNNDGEVGMPDVMYIVNYILNGKFPE